MTRMPCPYRARASTSSLTNSLWLKGDSGPCRKVQLGNSQAQNRFSPIHLKDFPSLPSRAGNLRRFPQPVADFGCTADRIHDFGADAVAPRQVAAFRLGVQSAEIAGHSDQLGTIATEPLRYEIRGPHFDQPGRNRQ